MARGPKADSSLHVIEVYMAWMNAYLEELHVQLVSDLSCDLHDGLVLGHLIQLTTGCNVKSNIKPLSVQDKCANVQSIIDFMKSKGVDVPSKAEDIVAGDLRPILDTIWLIILHFEIHSANRAAYQRTVSMGKRFLLEWLARELPDTIIDHRGSFLDLMKNGVFLLRIIRKYCATGEVVPADVQEVSVEDLAAALEVARSCLGLPGQIVSPAAILDATINEYALIIFVAIMRRKISALNGEEPYKGGAKVEFTPPVTPMKPKHVTPNEKRTTPTKGPHILRSPSSGGKPGSSPLSPSALQNLVEQRAMSHAAIQALQERIQASPYQTNTPRLQKKLPSFSAVFPMAPIDVVTKTKQQNCSKPHDKSEPVEGSLVMDQNDNLLGKGGEHPLDAVNNTRNVYSNVDEQFLEFMIDAVSRGYVPKEFVEGKAPISNGVANHESRERSSEVENSRNSEPRIHGQHSVIREPEDSQGLQAESDVHLAPHHMTEQADNASPRLEETGGNESGNSGRSGNPESSPVGSREETTRCPSLSEDPVVVLEETTIDGGEKLGNITSDGEKNDCDEEEDDPFMLYLDSIEHSALEFKLQIERAKIDTLHTLKTKLEEAYEGTPLEEIPSKFKEKLQEAIIELTAEGGTEQFSGSAETLVSMKREEDAELVSYLKDELDSVAAENFRLNQEIEVVKQYEDRYYEMKDEVALLNDEVVDIRDKYEKKKGESDFLAARVDELEKGIFNMRVEYEDQVREMHEETQHLQMMLDQFQNEAHLEDPAYNGYACENGEGIEFEEITSERNDAEFLSLRRELESMRLTLEESERRNEALKTATAADQSLVKCLEEKVADLESSVDKSHEDCSRYLSELQDAQRQMFSDRAKLSSYREETEALQRENHLLKSSLKIAENEIAYLQGKGKRTGEPWKDNRKQIWREIRQLEKILKDVHKEKRNIERKYVSFKQETDAADNSLTSYGLSPPQSPELETTGKAGLPKQDPQDPPAAKEEWVTSAPPTNEVATPPQKVQSWMEDIDPPTGAERKNSVSSGSNDSAVSPKPTGGSPLSQELQQLRSRVGSLEAEKASIVKELSSLRSSRFVS